MNALHRLLTPLVSMTVALVLSCLVVGGAHAGTQPYELTLDARITLSGQPSAPLTGTLSLSERGLCGPLLTCRHDYAIPQLELTGDGVELAFQLLPFVPGVFLPRFLDMRVEDGEVLLFPLVLEREILSEGQRSPGEGFVQIRELRLAPLFDLSSPGNGEAVFDDPSDRFPSAMRLNYALQDYSATIIFDSDGVEDGRIFLPFVESGSESSELLGTLAIHAIPIVEPPPPAPPLPAEGVFLGLGPDHGESHATGVSDDGRSVSGNSHNSRGSNSHGFRWTLDSGVRSPLGNLRGLGITEGHSISPDGTLLTGTFDSAASSRPVAEAARWNNELELDRLDLRPLFHFSVGEDITSAGDVVGWQQMVIPSRIQAIRWDAEGNRARLPYLNPAERPFARAHALSDDGSIAVGVSARDNVVLNTAVRWTDAGVEDLGALAADAFSWAWAVSSDGDTVAGWSGNEFGAREAFRWTADGSLEGLGDLPGGDFESEAYGVGANGWFVTGSSVTERGEEAFVWDPEHGMRSLQGMIEDALDIELEGWQLTRGTDITPDGRVFVGDGINPDGFTEAWIAILPEFELGSDAFQCYDAKRSRGSAKLGPQAVHLEDQFGETERTAVRVDQLCAPVAVNHGYVANPEAQLTCYALNRTKHSTKSLEPKTSRAKRGKKGKHGKKGKRGKKGKKGKKGKPGKPQPHQLLVTNSFGEDQALALDEAKLLCVPSTQVPADFGSNPNGASDLGIDHYQCYDAKPPPGVARFEPLRVALHDQYGDSDPLIAKPKRVCMPVDKNSEGILDEELLLTCYEIEKRRRREGHHGMEGDVLVNNQFGDDQAYDVKRPKSVCLPSTAEVVD